MRRATTTTFSVSDVLPATTPLQEVPYKEAVEALLTAGSVGPTTNPVSGQRSATGLGSRLLHV